jgi:DNA processing protein
VDPIELSPDDLFGAVAPIDRLAVSARYFALGDPSLLREPKVAVVGTRNASEAGLAACRALTQSLTGVGIVVVSGLARGIDRAAHETAIDAGGRTIAVIGTPIDRVYPAEHRALQERIAREHLVVSQFPTGWRTRPESFLARNHTMARLAHATVVVEAGEVSGALALAREALRLGRRVFVREVSVADSRLTWPRNLLKAGASLLRDDSPGDTLSAAVGGVGPADFGT